MKIAYGVEVEDKYGNRVGVVNHVIRDSWTGGIRKFGIWKEDRARDILVSPDDIEELKEDKIILAVALDEYK